jgi:hypothetical protein
MPRQDKVPRPTKLQEYEIYFASSQAEKGWRDLKATTANALADCWDALTKAHSVMTTNATHSVTTWEP